jgi:hypothetical protein
LTSLFELISNIINRVYQIKNFALALAFDNLSLNNEVDNIIYSIIVVTLQSLSTQSIIQIILRIKFVKILNYLIV